MLPAGIDVDIGAGLDMGDRAGEQLRARTASPKGWLWERADGCFGSAVRVASEQNLALLCCIWERIDGCLGSALMVARERADGCPGSALVALGAR